MSKRISFSGILIIVLTIALLSVIGFARSTQEEPKNVYVVYLEGKKIGLLEDQEDLYDLIDKEQKNIKNTFGVEKVYPPENLETVEYTTYSKNLSTAKEIYKEIEKKSTFTIKGYRLNIIPKNGEETHINILHEEDLEPALLDAVSAFIPKDQLNAYMNDTQIEVTDKGKTIESVYFSDKITLKESYISVDEDIITNQEDLAKYLLFGTLEPQQEYVVKDGDTIETIAYNNALSSEELLIANPKLSSANALLSEGQILNVGLIKPRFTVVEESELTEDFEEAFGTIIEKDNTLFDDESYVKQEGVKGVKRITQKIIYENGDIANVWISDQKEISPPVNKIYVKGTKPSYNWSHVPPAASSTEWGWPTVSPYVITSRYGYRWGKNHLAIDIAGCATGSPIFSATEGTVIAINKSCPNKGYYGSPCGGQHGNYVYIKTSSGLTIYYAHLRNDIKVSVGQTVTKGQRIGSLGSSGSSTGPHLHFAIKDEEGNALDPCKAAFAC